MIKKLSSIIAFILIVFTIIPTTHATKIGSVVGTVYHTDIVAYINNYAIPSYVANGTSVVVAEDLRNYGFDVMWDANARTLSINRNKTTQPTEMSFSKTGSPSTKFTNILYTDIKVYANGTRIPSYTIDGGYTMVPLESLTMFGTYNWVSYQRALKLWVDGLHIRNTMQEIAPYRLSIVDATLKLRDWLKGKLDPIPYDLKYYIELESLERYNGQEYYKFRLKISHPTHNATVALYCVPIDGTEIYQLSWSDYDREVEAYVYFDTNPKLYF